MKVYRFAVFAALCLAVASCGEKDKTTPDSPTTPPISSVDEEYEKLGTYTFGEKEYGIYSTCFSINEYNEVLMFSPLRPKDSKTTVLMVAVHKELDGKSLDVTNYSQNFDYYLRYESPAVLYPENIRPESGTIYVKRVGEDEFDVNVDVIFADGTPLRLKYNGVFSEN